MVRPPFTSPPIATSHTPTSSHRFFSITLRKPTTTPRRYEHTSHAPLSARPPRPKKIAPPGRSSRRASKASSRRTIGFLRNRLVRSRSPDPRRRPRRGPSSPQSSFPASHSPDAGRRRDPPSRQLAPLLRLRLARARPALSAGCVARGHPFAAHSLVPGDCFN